MMSENLPKFLTPLDVQSACGGEGVISLRSIQRAAQRREIPGMIRLGKKYFFQRAPVLQWIEGGMPGLRLAA